MWEIFDVCFGSCANKFLDEKKKESNFCWEIEFFGIMRVSGQKQLNYELK
jgi:hypothetical protein